VADFPRIVAIPQYGTRNPSGLFAVRLIALREEFLAKEMQSKKKKKK
jgi:hypothetical protein